MAWNGMGVENLERFRGCHAGKVGFVIGAGPSLRTVDARCLSEYVTICCNGSILKFRDADYFMFTDCSALEFSIWSEFPSMRCEIFANDYFDCRAYDEQRRVLGSRFHTFPKRWTAKTIDEQFLLSTEFPVCLGDTVMHCAVNIAHIMGCDPIVLLGADCGEMDGRLHYTEYEGQPRDAGYDRAMARSIEQKNIERHDNGGWAAFNEISYASVIGHWDHIRRVNPGVQIINASGGILDVFPRMSLPAVLEQYGDRRR